MGLTSITRLIYSIDEQATYNSDLTKRSQANIVRAFTLEHRGLPLHLARTARENQQDNWLAGFLTEYFVKGVAFLYADGSGVLAVKGGAGFWDLYQNARRVQDNIKFMTLGVETLGGALDTQRRIYSNTVNGIDNIVTQVPPQIPNGGVRSITNKSVGDYKLFGQLWWWERESYSEVSPPNMTNYDTVFQIIGDYGNTGFLGASYQPLVGEGATWIATNQNGIVPVRYKQSDRGASPDANSTVEMDILGSTDTGTYYVSHISTQ